MKINNENSQLVWEDRYKKGDETLDQQIDRVLRFISNNNEEYNEFKNVIDNKLFLPAGRTMSNAGLDKNLTMNNCFKEGAKVITKRGLINIEDVKIGDYVITEDNSWQKVNNVMCRDYTGDLYKISGSSLYDDIYCTPNHQFLTQDGWIRADRLSWGKTHRLKTPTLVFEKTYEIVDLLNILEPTKDFEVRLLDNGKLKIFRKCNKNRHNNNINWASFGYEINRYIKLTPEFRYFIGRFLGDGSITRRKGKRNHAILQIVFNKEKEKEDALYCKKIGDETFGFESNYRETNQNVIVLRWENEIIATWFFKEFGEKCDGKYLSDKYLGDLEIAKGLFDSDGFIGTHGRGRLVLKNQNLIKWFRDTLYLNGYNTEKMKKNSKYENTYETSFSSGISSKGFGKIIRKKYHDKTHNLITNDIFYKDYVHIDNIEIIENQTCKVYNLSVDNVHSYTVNGVIVHNCFTLNFVPDSMNGIFETIKKGALVHKAGGGTGYNFSLIRPNGTPTSNDAIASGVVSFMNVFDSQTKTVNQGSRRGANMGVLCIYHPDIEDFIIAKSWDKDRLTQFNMSVLVDDDFMIAVKNNEDIYLHYPCMTENGEIENNVDKWIIKKKINAKELWDKIMQQAYNQGEPGVLFYDNLNKDNNLKYMEKIVATNPCSEYISGILNVDDNKEYMGACNLGSLLLHNFVKNPFTKDSYFDYDKLKETIYTAIKLLDNIIDINYYPLEAFENYQKNIRTVGLGITGLGDTFCMLGMSYGSKESINFTDELMEFITYNSYMASVNLAIDRGVFPFFKEEFADSEFILKHINNKNSKCNWEELKKLILKYGIRNGRLISIAPCGTMSLTYGENCSSGLEPIIKLETDRKVRLGGQEEKNEKNVKVIDYAYDLWKKTPNNCVSKDVFKTALDLSVKEHLDILKTIAYHVDMNCSKTINIPTEMSFEEVKDIYTDCWKAGIKGCTIFRPNEIRQGIIGNNNEVKTNTNWLKKPEDTIYKSKKISTGCGKLILFVGYSQSEDRIVDIYVKKSAEGGCVHNIDAVVICMSGMLRLGGNLDNIEKAFRGCGTCNSFTTARLKGKKLSKGRSCPTAILNAIKEVQDEIKNEKISNETDLQSKYLPKCPECGEPLSTDGQCVYCSSCGYSKC